MHDCLRIPEILDQVLTYVLDDQPGRKGQNNVVSVALTCREVVEVALDVAWKTQSSMVPVIKTLPQRCWMDVASSRVNPFHDFSPTFDREFVLRVDKLTAEEEERFMFYAKRIRRLEYLPFAFHAVPQSGCPADLEIIRTIWSMRTDKNQPLFPNLQHLVFAVVVHAAASLDIFLETKHVSLALYWHSPSDITNILFPIIEKYALNMQELDLGDFQEVERPGQDDTALSELVCKMKDLRALSCGPRPLNTKAFHHLSSLPYLHKLRVPNDSQDILRGVQQKSLRTPFPELKELVIRETRQSSFAALIKQLRPVHIQKLVIQLCHVPPTRVILDMFVSLAENSSSPGNVLSIEFKSIHNPDRASHRNQDPFNLRHCQTVIDGSTLQPLLSLRNLTVLDLDLLCKFDLGDEQIKAMADAWPRLRRLKLGTLVGWYRLSSITYDGLLYLLLKCPELCYLALAFDAGSHIPPTSTVSPAHVNSNINYLYVGDSKIGANNPDEIGRFLAVVFPRCLGITGRWIMQKAVEDLSEWFRVVAAMKKHQGLNQAAKK